MRNEIIGPLSPEEKAEIREILIGMGEEVEPTHFWDNIPPFDIIASYSEDCKEWGVFIMVSSHKDYTPTITFEDFKTKYVFYEGQSIMAGDTPDNLYQYGYYIGKDGDEFIVSVKEKDQHFKFIKAV